MVVLENANKPEILQDNMPEEISPPTTAIMDSSGSSKKLPNHIEEYLQSNTGDNAFRDLFEGKPDNIDLRTEVNENEVTIINRIFISNEFLNENGVPDIYNKFLNNYMRLKVSFNRGSRQEFVDINKKDRFENNLNKFNNFANLSKVKE